MSKWSSFKEQQILTENFRNWADNNDYGRPLSYPQELALNESLLEEGILPIDLKDVIQYLAAGSAEYGLGAVTMPAAGAGVAVGPAVETTVDAAFGAEAVKSAVEGAYTFGQKLEEFAELWDTAMEAYNSQDLEKYYDTLVNLIREALPMLGAQAEEKVDEIAKKLQNLVEKALESLLDTIEAAIKMVVPDATAGLAVSKAITTVITTTATRPFSIATGAIDKVDILRKFIADPAIAVDFFEDVLTQVIKLMRTASEKLEDVSWKKTFLATMAIGATGVGAVAAPNILALRALGPAGLRKAADLLEKQLPMVLDVIEKILVVLVPLVLNGLAIYQILMTGDYKETSGEIEDTTPAGEKLDGSITIGPPEATTTTSKMPSGRMELQESLVRKMVRKIVIEEIRKQKTKRKK